MRRRKCETVGGERDNLMKRKPNLLEREGESAMFVSGEYTKDASESGEC